jgi:hypothetical protein
MPTTHSDRRHQPYFFVLGFEAKSITIGAATKIEEYAPKTTPTNIANENPRKTSPPKNNNTVTTKNTVVAVITVLDIV